MTWHYHLLKVHPDFYWPLFYGAKNFEIRIDDRGFARGDFLVLREFNAEKDRFTRKPFLLRRIGFILAAHEGLQPGFKILGLCHIADTDKSALLDLMRESGDYPFRQRKDAVAA